MSESPASSDPVCVTVGMQDWADLGNGVAVRFAGIVPHRDMVTLEIRGRHDQPGEPEETATVCGLPIDGGEEIGQPLAALVVVKSFESEVGVSYRVRATAGLSSVEALGMAGVAVLRLKNALSE